MSAGQPDAWHELKFSIAELHLLISRLGSVLGADDDHAQAITWDEASWRAADLYERALADMGTLAGTYLRCSIIDRRGIDPLGGL